MFSLLLAWNTNWTNSQVAGGLRHHCTHVTSMRCHSADVITWCWVGEYMHHLFKRHMMECRQSQYAPITINSLCLTWSKVVSFFFLNSDAVRGWQQNYNQAWNHCGSSHRNADFLVVNVLVWTVLTWIRIHRIHPRNTRRHQCVVASTERLTTGRSLSLTRPYDNSHSLVTELLISQDFPQRQFCTYFTVS